MRVLVVAASLVFVATGCGITSSGDASTAGPADVPYGLLLNDGAATTTTLADISSTTVDVWFVAADRVIPLVREVRRPLSIDRALRALLDGPTDAEASLGVRSAAATSAIVVGEVDDDGVAAVELAETFSGAPPREQLLALAQVVHTVTELDAVTAVVFTLDGVPVEVPRGDGSLTADPVTRSDYRALVHR